MKAKVQLAEEGLYSIVLPTGETKLTDQDLSGVETVDWNSFNKEVPQWYALSAEKWVDDENPELSKSYRFDTRTIWRREVQSELTEYTVYDCNGECEKCICGVKAELTEKEEETKAAKLRNLLSPAYSLVDIILGLPRSVESFEIIKKSALQVVINKEAIHGILSDLDVQQEPIKEREQEGGMALSETRLMLSRMIRVLSKMEKNDRETKVLEDAKYILSKYSSPNDALRIELSSQEEKQTRELSEITSDDLAVLYSYKDDIIRSVSKSDKQSIKRIFKAIERL